MPDLIIRPEIQCHPAWVYRNGMYDNVSPRSLGLSSALVRALGDWAARWDATYDLVNDPANPTFDSPAAEQHFWDEGRRLGERLRSELDDRWEIRLDFDD